MRIRELSEQEFAAFALKHEQNNFYQTVAWGELKATNGWKPYYVGLVDDKNNILGASLLLSKKIVLNINMVYAPRGFLIDYSNYSLLKEFTNGIKKYAKKKGAIFVKIDPYVMYKERDIDGNIVNGGVDNSITVDNLKKLGYVHKGFTIYHGTLQPRWMFVLDVENKTEQQILDEVYNQTTRHCINKTLNSSYIVREAKMDDLKDYKKISHETGKRRGFIDRPLSYYEAMYKVFSKHDMIKILLVDFDCNDYIKRLNEEKQKQLALKEDLNAKLEAGANKNHINGQMKEINNVINATEKKIIETEELKGKHGNIITMSAAMFILYGDEVVYLHSGTYEEFLKYNAPYRIQWEIIKYAIKHKYKRYNFYGISGEFNKDKDSYGVYYFKKGFNGKVVELIGEFDLVINKPLYNLYNLSYKLYRYLKNVKSPK